VGAGRAGAATGAAAFFLIKRLAKSRARCDRMAGQVVANLQTPFAGLLQFGDHQMSVTSPDHDAGGVGPQD
jgi:hypothetical protein